MGNAGKVLAIIGATVGVVCVLFSLVVPGLFSWYCQRVSSGGSSANLYLTPFGTFVGDDFPEPDEIVSLVLIGGILVLAGASLCIVGVAKEMKSFGIIGGILMILGPTLLVFDLIGQVSEFSEDMHILAVAYDGNVFFSNLSPSPGVTITLGLYFGYVISNVGGVLGLIGGAIG
ncbi:MAG: hypothetical protein ACFFA6_09275 [Promethearchaeota archaeon]